MRRAPVFASLVFILGSSVAGAEVYEGFGVTPGGAGGEVYTVTSLANSGAGTLRDAVLSRHYNGSLLIPRTVVFSVAGDFTRDGHVDAADLNHLLACTTHAGVPQLNSTCLDADLDGDTDVDQSDFGRFQRCLTDAGAFADPNCAN